MKDQEGSPDTGASPQDESQLLERLRAVEANNEFLLSAVRSQERLADHLAVAIKEVAIAQQVAEDAILANGLREALRSIKERFMKRLPVGRNVAPVSAEPVDSPLEWSPDMNMNDDRYPQWIALYDTVDEGVRSELLARLGDLEGAPLVSVVLPVYNTPEEFLREAIDSVRAQLYSNWELCISDDCSSLPHVVKILDEYAKLDSRIRVDKRDSNGHISASSNSAIALARGEWICLMDHDDVMAEHALAVAVLEIRKTPDAAILYSDEDHIDAEGIRGDPYFKPDYDPLLILGQNYFSHLSMFRADLVRLVGGFREGYEGSQDWDLVLRVLEHIRPDQVIHVPHVLYHWRVHPGSTASSVSAKPYVVEASRRVVQEHLDRIGITAEVSTVWGSSFNRIAWALPRDAPKVSVIVLPRTGARLRRCIESIRIFTTYPNVEIVLLDDGAFRPPMRQFLRDQSDWLTVVEQPDDISDSAQRNFAARAASGDVLCFIHDDVEVLSDTWLEEIVGMLSHPGIGCAGIKLLYPDLSIQHAGLVVGIGGTVGNPHRSLFDRFSYGYFGRLRLTQCPSAVSWSCLAVRRDAFESVGGFSEEHCTGMFGDVDLCLRLSEAGWRTGWTPHAEMIHHELPGDSRGIEGENLVRFDRDIRYLHSRWGPLLENDPGYNPNLSLAHESLPLAWPPRRRFV
jgi:GT2 family glycosyltransferase